MGTPLRVLIVEDSEEDTLLIVRELKRGGFDPIHERVETAEAMSAALTKQTWDLILADYSMPHFSGLEALKLSKESGLDLPFIIVSGSIGEDVAVEAMKSGAHDYLMKNNLTRLIPAIQQGLRGTEGRRKLKVSQNALQESEKRYRQVVENATEIIYALDEKGNFTYGNPAGLKVTGYSLAELRSFNYADLVLPEHRERVMEIYINQFRQRIPTTHVEFPFFNKAGEIIWFGQNTSLVIEDGKVVGFQIIARDITERKHAEEALRESEKKFRELFDEAPVGYFEYDSQGRITSVNRTELEMLGYTPEEMTGQPVWKFIIEEEEARQQILAKLAGTMPPGRAIERTYRRKDGTTFPVLVEDRLIRDGNGRITGIRCTLQDITNRKQREEALRSGEEKYRTILENIEDGYYEVDIAGNFTFFNDSMCRIYGYPREELMGMNNRRYTDQENAKELFKAFNRVYRTGESTKEFDWEIIRKDGTKRSIEASASLIKDPSDNRIGFRGIVRDITERKRAEDMLGASEERYRTLFEGAAEGILVADIESKQFKYVNPATCRMLGYTAEELTRLSLADIHPKEALDYVVAEFEAQARGEKTLSPEIPCLRKDGRVIYTSVATAPVVIDGRKCNVGFFMDVTERKHAEENLKQSEENARQLAQENAIMAEVGRIISSTLDIDEVYEGFSAEVKKIIPFDRIVINVIDIEKNTVKNVYVAGKGLYDRNVKDIYPFEGSGDAEIVRTESSLLIQTEDFNEYKDRFPMLLSTFQAGFRSIMNIPLFSKGKIIGGLLLRSHKPYAYTDKDVRLAERIASQIAGAVVNAQLYAERIHAEEERAALQDQLRQSQKMEAIGRLAGGVAHDFNNILTVIKGYSQLSLTEMKKEDPFRENVEEIKKAADRAADLTRQLLAFSRRQVMEMKVLDLNDLLKNLDKLLRRVIGEDIELTTILDENLGRVKTDPGQIEQVIMNLAVNARDAMSKGGKLTIETANVDLDQAYARAHVAVKPGPYVMISASDTGVGMPPEVRDRIFEPFFTTKEKGKGTGLGLSTVYGIVKQSGGNIWVYSEPEKGTTFKIYLPRVDEPFEELKEKLVKEELPCGNETILIVEDEEDVLKLAGRILSRQGYHILEASGGEEALRICK
jgi:PAS domain S-box-containing protein